MILKGGMTQSPKFERDEEQGRQAGALCYLGMIMDYGEWICNDDQGRCIVIKRDVKEGIWRKKLEESHYSNGAYEVI